MLFPLLVERFWRLRLRNRHNTLTQQWRGLVGDLRRTGTVGEMPTRHHTPPDPADIFLDTEALAERYGIGTTKAKELVRSGDLPTTVVAGMVRIPLVALRAWELARSLADTPADPARSSEQVTVLAPPAARPAGRPARKQVA